MISCGLSKQQDSGIREFSAFPEPPARLPLSLSAARERESSKHRVRRINVTRKEVGSELSGVSLRPPQAQSVDGDN